MKYFLAKTDPKDYCLTDLANDVKTVWDGVRNPLAIKAIQAMSPGDKVFIYHSGGVSAVVGLARVASRPRPDRRDGRSWVVDLEYAGELDPPTTLADIRAAGKFGSWALLRQPRLSTMEAPAEFVEWMRLRYPNLKF